MSGKAPTTPSNPYGIQVSYNTGGNEYQQSTTAQAAFDREPVSPDFDADAYVADMNAATLDNLIVNGPNLPGAGDRRAAIQAAERRLASLVGSQTPANNGMDPNTGGQQGVTPNPDWNPGEVTGTDDIAIPDTVVDYGAGSDNDVGGPPVIPSVGPPPLTNGMDPDTGGQNFPDPPAENPGGGQSPAVNAPEGDWGQFQDFYQNQFAGLLGQSQQRQEGAMAAAIRREQEEAAPQEDFQADWSWADLPDVRVGDGTDRYANWGLASNIESESGVTTNREIYDQIKNSLSAETRAFFDNTWSQPGSSADGVWWSTLNNPVEMAQGWNPDPDANPYAAPAVDELRDRLFEYTSSGDSIASVPAGYAHPR